MATAFASMGSTPNHFRADLDMDSFFDFNQSTLSNTPRVSSRQSVQAGSSSTAAQNMPTAAPADYEETEDRQVFAGPSHEYDRFKQQTGVPMGSVASLAHINQPMQQSFGGDQIFGGFNSGIDEMSFNSGLDNTWSTGIDTDADMNSDLPAMFYPGNQSMQSTDFIDPASIDSAEEPASNVGRLWPGMHQQQAQQAAIAKQQAQAQQQQQTKAHGKARAQSHQSDPHTEESITRLLAQMRQASAAPTNDEDDVGYGGLMPYAARLRKDEEDMDEDERLLASEEGKKLSSKERRQLRNKVSARAFRSRRKGKLSTNTTTIVHTLTLLQSTSVSSRARLLRSSRNATNSSPKTTLSTRRTLATAASSRLFSATHPSLHSLKI